MIPARHNPFFVHFFRIYTLYMILRHFDRAEIKGELIDRKLPVLMIGNHFSWWDGFIANLINIRIFKRKIHVMMLEDQLHGRMFLNKAGAYSIRRGSRSVLESLSYTAGLLENPAHLVVLYPQGEFESIYRFPLHFEKGITTIAGKVNNDFHLVFYAALIDYFDRKKPVLSIYIKEFPLDIAGSASKLESAYNDFYSDCTAKQRQP